ncbi:MAG: hypothetical protein QHH15_04490 [Candidatus Thermoplasmatota archaeon]|nr:hypothetical protein [Candidatus Thermoplasmatota archaeon]
MRKTILPILIIVSFLTLAAAPAISAPINIMIGQNNKNLKETTTTIDVDETKIEKFMNQIEELKTWLQENRPFKDLVLTDQEKAEIKSRVSGLITTLNEFLVENGQDPITTDWLWNELFETEIGRSTIASIGRGFCFIPFYDYETFLGVMLRPMWFIYPPLFLGGAGYTGNFNVNVLPPRVEYGDRMGPHIVRTTMFTGLYINVGELGIDTLFSGTILLLGRARIVM